MKSIKRLFSLFLGVLTLFTCTQSAFAEVEIWTFSDDTRITRFNRDDFETMIKLYDEYVKENEKHKFTTCQNVSIKVAGLGYGILALICSAVLIYNGVNTHKNFKDNTGGFLGAGALAITGLASVVASFYPEYKNSKVEKDITKKSRDERTLWIGVKDIRDMLIEERNMVNQVLRDGYEDRTKQINEIKDFAPELIPLMSKGFKREDLQKYDGYYILIERPYRENDYSGSNVVIPRIYKDYECCNELSRNRCSGKISDLINRLEAEGIHGKEYKKIIIEGNTLKEIEGDDNGFKKYK